MTNPKRVSGWKIVGIILGVVVLSLAVVIVSIWLGVNRRFDLVQQRAQELAQLPDPPNPNRPVLYGSVSPGDAGREYAFAEAMILGGGFYQKLRNGLENLSPTDLAAVERGYPILSRAVLCVKRGTACGTVSIPNDKYHDTSLSVGTLGLLQVRRLIAAGKGKEASETLLDTCQYGRDNTEAQGMPGRLLLMWSFAELRDLLLSEQLDQESLRFLASGLEILDGSFPSIERDRLRWARKWAIEARTPPNKNWFYDLLHRDTHTTYCDLELRALGASRLDWLHERQLLRSLDLELSESRNLMARESTINLEGSAAYSRHLRAQLRLLRMAMQYRAGDGVPDLDDPFGGKIRTSLNGEVLKLWSIGRDAVDDAGVGGWEFKGKDVVLELGPK